MPICEEPRLHTSEHNKPWRPLCQLNARGSRWITVNQKTVVRLALHTLRLVLTPRTTLTTTLWETTINLQKCSHSTTTRETTTPTMMREILTARAQPIRRLQRCTNTPCKYRNLQRTRFFSSMVQKVTLGHQAVRSIWAVVTQ